LQDALVARRATATFVMASMIGDVCFGMIFGERGMEVKGEGGRYHLCGIFGIDDGQTKDQRFSATSQDVGAPAFLEKSRAHEHGGFLLTPPPSLFLCSLLITVLFAAYAHSTDQQ
jgi:hypothetical protein